LKAVIGRAWEAQFQALFSHLGLQGSRALIDRTITPVLVPPEQGEGVNLPGKDEGAHEFAD
jgi:hypothetical protein